MNKKLIIVIAVLFASFVQAYSQDGSFGAWTSLSIEKDLNKLDVGAEAELRTNYFENGPLVERASFGLGADYKLFKGVKLGVGYQIMSKLDAKYSKYLMRNRFTTSLNGKLKLNAFEFSLRERLQLTQKDASKRIRDDGRIDTYKVNPELAWRNRMQVSYNIPKFRIDPTFSVETFFDLNNPDGNSFAKYRYTLGFDYKINKTHIFELYGVLNSEVIVNPEDDDFYGKYILGASYKYSF